MIFAHSFILWFLPLLVLGGGWLLWYSKRLAAKRLERFGPPERLSRILLTVNQRAKFQKPALVLAALFLLTLAAARPMIGPRAIDTDQSGAEFFIALDVSKSMLVRDVEPDRLDAVKASLSKWLESRHGDRIGLILIAGDAFVQAPLTNDYTALREVLAQTGHSSISQGGTNLASAIEMAAAAFEATQTRQKALIIISDGDNLEGDPLGVAGAIRASSNMSIFTVGVGTEAGGSVPIPAKGITQDFSKPPTRFIRDEYGVTARSRLDERVLRNIAAAGGGQYFRFEPDDKFWEALYAEALKPMAGTMEKIDVNDYDDLFQIPLLLALLLLAAEVAISSRLANPPRLRSAIQIPETSPAPPAAKLTGAARLGLMVPIVAALTMTLQEVAASSTLQTIQGAKELMEQEKPSEAAKLLWEASQQQTKDPYLIFNYGIASYASGEFQEAITAFTEVARHPKFGRTAQIHLGNVHFRMGQEFRKSKNPSGAIVAWERSVEFYKTIENPDSTTKHNLKVTENLLAEVLYEAGSKSLDQAKSAQLLSTRLSAAGTAFERLEKAASLAPQMLGVIEQREEARQLFSESLQEKSDELAKQAAQPKVDPRKKQGLYEEAVSVLNQAVEIDPNNSELANKMAELRADAASDYADTAEQKLAQAQKVAKVPDHVGFRDQQKSLSEAIANADIALEFEAENAKATSVKAEAVKAMEESLMANAERMEEAGDTAAALNKRPDSAAARYTTALQNYQDALDLNDANSQARNQIPKIQEKLAEQLTLHAQEEMKRAEVAASAPPGKQGKLLEGIGHLEKASQILGQAEALAPGENSAAALKTQAQERLSELRNRLDQSLTAAAESSGDQGEEQGEPTDSPGEDSQASNEGAPATGKAPLNFSEIRGRPDTAGDFTDKSRSGPVRDW